MATKIFDIDCEWEGYHNGETVLFKGQIELDQRILDAVDDDFRKHLYKLMDDQEVAGHIAYNFIVNNVDRVQLLDGWADQPEDVVCQIL
jgi:hypothetical protein